MANFTVFAQVMSLRHEQVFRRCVERDGGDTQMKSFSCHDQWLAIAFAQLPHRESLRDLASALGSRTELLYQMGFRSPVMRSTLADDNKRRDWRIYADRAQALIRRSRQLYVNEPFAEELDQTIFAFDATAIDLSLTLFPWAHFRLHESAIKLHTPPDLRGSIPIFLALTKATVNQISTPALAEDYWHQWPPESRWCWPWCHRPPLRIRGRRETCGCNGFRLDGFQHRQRHQGQR